MVEKPLAGSNYPVRVNSSRKFAASWAWRVEHCLNSSNVSTGDFCDPGNLSSVKYPAIFTLMHRTFGERGAFVLSLVRLVECC